MLSGFQAAVSGMPKKKVAGPCLTWQLGSVFQEPGSPCSCAVAPAQATLPDHTALKATCLWLVLAVALGNACTRLMDIFAETLRQATLRLSYVSPAPFHVMFSSRT